MYRTQGGKNMNNAALYPFNKISHGLIRFRGLLDYHITAVIDFTFNIGEDVGKVIEGNAIGVTVEDNIDHALEKADTLIISDAGEPYHNTDIYIQYNLQERWKEVIKKANDFGIRIISIHEIKNPSLLAWMKDNHIQIQTFYKTNQQVLKIIDSAKRITTTKQVKKIGIYGTRPCIGKFTTQMYLLKALKEQGLKASALITEPTAELFNQYDVDPLRCLDILGDPIKYNDYIKAIVTNCISDENDYILMASQGALAYSVKDYIYANLVKISSMVEFNPDAILLVVGFDDDDAIKDCLDTIRIYCNGKKPIAFLLPDKVEVGYCKYEVKTMEDIQLRAEHLRKKFDIDRVESIHCVTNMVDLIK